jgi:hypothetical protein
MRKTTFDIPDGACILALKSIIMKSAKLIASLLLIVCSLSFFSCTKQNELATDTKDILTQGQWKVNYYFSDQDHTTQFTDYSFQFNPNGKLSCTDSKNLYAGTWRVIRNLNNADWLEMNLTSVTSDLQQLNFTWKLTEVGFQSIGMITDSSRPYTLRFGH